MHRANWWHGLWLMRSRFALLAASLAALSIALVGLTVSLTAAAEPEDIGSIAVAEKDTSRADASDPRPVADDRRAAAGPTAPTVSREAVSRADSEQGRSEDASPAEEAAEPVRLRVPAVDLDAPLDSSGVRQDGLMEIPDDGDRAGWYRYGSTPGEGSGSVVLAGHVDTAEGLGAMAALREVPLDAVVEVEMADGSVLAYEVVGRETIAKDELPTDDIFDRAGPERLTLITCGGPWRSSESSYRDNIVVVATPVDQH